jgi:hypothetical protein
VLVRRCQQVGFGKIGPFIVCNGDPEVTPETDVFVDVKLDGDDAPRSEYSLGDFVLSKEVVRLFAELDAFRNGGRSAPRGACRHPASNRFQSPDLRHT